MLKRASMMMKGKDKDSNDLLKFSNDSQKDEFSFIFARF